MKLVLMLALPMFAAGNPFHQQCRILDTIPFFQTPARSADQAREVEILTEFARFTQSQVPVMLTQFSRYKRILNQEVEGLLRSYTTRMSRARLFRQAAPSTEGPTTPVPTTEGPTTAAPTTEGPTTAAPTTEGPTTAAPTTEGPPTPAPSTEGPTTVAPTTEAVTTAATTEAAATEAGATTEAGASEATTEVATTTAGETDMSEDDIEKSIETAIDSIVKAIKDTFEGFKNKPLSISNLSSIGAGVLKGIKNLLENFGIELPSEVPDLDISPPPIGDWSLADWPLLCQAIWWPKNEEHCQQVRCAACSTSVFAAARVCQKTEGSADFRCMRNVLQDGVCNYCIVDYLQ